ncbi:MAG: glycosyltransferase family 4 protein [Candidatus Daviesbacteria bacterium]|nr:MAG: glycosyltransferase family 4 protein [Candidatus Daviesbacteria bacterium]
MAKKIAFLCQGYGTVNRGVETYVGELSKRLQKDFTVTILTGQDSGNLSKIIKGNFDLVIATNGRMQALKASLGRLVGKYRLLISGQAGIGRDDLWNIAVCIPDVYVALTDHEKNWAQKWAWKTKVKKIPNGVDLAKFSSQGKKIKIDLPGPIILSVGALEWYKHHELAIEALSKLKDVSLLIVGSGSKLKQLLELANLKIPGRFKIISVKFDQMPDVYRSADLFTLPSWNREAFGIVYVEAMASGLPVVAPDDSPRREIVGNAGVLTQVYEAKKYAQAIEEALNKDWKNTPQKQAEKFSWDKIADEYKKLIEEICK